MDKIIDYPGFNVPAGPRVIDVSMRYLACIYDVIMRIVSAAWRDDRKIDGSTPTQASLLCLWIDASQSLSLLSGI